MSVSVTVRDAGFEPGNMLLQQYKSTTLSHWNNPLILKLVHVLFFFIFLNKILPIRRAEFGSNAEENYIFI